MFVCIQLQDAPACPEGLVFAQNNLERDFQEIRAVSFTHCSVKENRNKKKATLAAVSNLKTPHVSRVPGILQAVLVAL